MKDIRSPQRRAHLCLGSMAFALTLTGSAFAQERSRVAFEVGAGWIGFPDNGLVSEVLVSGTARWHALPRVSVGPEVVFVNGNRHTHLVVTGNLVVNLRPPTAGGSDRIVPFVVVGGGMFRTVETFAAGSFDSTEGAFTAGGGVRTSASDRVTVGIDARVGWETHIRINGFVGFRLGP